MTRFKKCEYCHQSSKTFYKMRGQNELFDPHREQHQESGDFSWRGRPVKLFLCDVCHDFFFPDDKEKTKITIADFERLPEIYEIMYKKGNWLP